MTANRTGAKPIEVAVRRHSLKYEPPDTIVVVLHGSVDEDDAAVISKHMVDWSDGAPCLLVIVDIRQLSSMSQQARKVGASMGYRLPPRATAVVGGSFAVRMLMDLVLRASELLGTKKRFTKHCPDEAAARAWVAEMRPLLLATAGDGKGAR